LHPGDASSTLAVSTIACLPAEGLRALVSEAGCCWFESSRADHLVVAERMMRRSSKPDDVRSNRTDETKIVAASFSGQDVGF
jgi:hypothetical protein